MRKENSNCKIKYKIIIIFIIIVSIFANTNFTYGNLEDNEKIDLEKIKIETISTVNNTQNKPILNSRIGLIYDRNSGNILYEKNGNKQTPMASTTKIMTAIIVLEQANMKETVTIESKAAGTGGSRLGLQKNDKISVQDLLYGLMLCSGNDAAVALAIHIGGSIENFANLMNQKAKELKLINTHFVVPHGLDNNEHYTTAYELAKITDYALKNEEFKKIVGTKSYYVTINGKTKQISNTNELLGNLQGVYGVKTGFTNGAGRCLVTACKRGNLDIITIIIGANTKKERTSDSIQLIEYANKNYKIIDIEEIIKEKFCHWQEINQKRIIINKGIQKEIELEIEKMPYETMAIQNTKEDNIELEITSLFYLEAPVMEKTIIGTAKVKIDDEIIQTLKIYCKKQIEKKQIMDYFKEFMKIYATSNIR